MLAKKRQDNTGIQAAHVIVDVHREHAASGHRKRAPQAGARSYRAQRSRCR